MWPASAAKEECSTWLSMSTWACTNLLVRSIYSLHARFDCSQNSARAGQLKYVNMSPCVCVRVCMCVCGCVYLGSRAGACFCTNNTRATQALSRESCGVAVRVVSTQTCRTTCSGCDVRPVCVCTRACLSTSSGGMVINELWTLDIEESVLSPSVPAYPFLRPEIASRPLSRARPLTLAWCTNGT